MKKILFSLILAMLAGMANAQSYTREGNVFKQEITASNNIKATGCTWIDSKGVQYPVFINEASGRCFIYKTSKKTGKEYKQYLGEKVSKEICKTLGIKYKEK